MFQVVRENHISKLKNKKNKIFIFQHYVIDFEPQILKNNDFWKNDYFLKRTFCRGRLRR